MATITETRTQTAKIVPHLWFADKAIEAANFYTTLFPDSRVDEVTGAPAESPSGPPGSVQIVEFTLAGQPFMKSSWKWWDVSGPPERCQRTALVARLLFRANKSPLLTAP